MNVLRNHQKVHIGNFDSFEQKFRRLVTAGTDNCMVVADFDNTLTASNTEAGERCDISYGVFAKAAIKRFPHYEQLFIDLDEKYSPIENDPMLSKEQKSSAMMDWWLQANDLILSAEFKHHELLDLIKKSTMRLRSNGILYLAELEQLKIPLIILSAGITNIIEASLLLEFGRVPENVQIVSNTMYVNDKGIFYKFSDPVINSYSKSGKLLEKCFEKVTDLHKRHHIILLGDSLGDLTMVDGCHLLRADNISVLKIGFLNENSDTLMKKFVENFDLVIVEDQSMDILRHLNHMLFGVGEPLHYN